MIPGCRALPIAQQLLHSSTYSSVPAHALQPILFEAHMKAQCKMFPVKGGCPRFAEDVPV